jgi:hypothetical protein
MGIPHPRAFAELVHAICEGWNQMGTSINPVDCGAGLLSCCCGALDASAAAGLDRLSPVSSRLAADFLSFGRSYPMAARRSWKTSRSML